MITSESAKPQWSPVMKTGNTNREDTTMITSAKPQWSPVMKTGNTRTGRFPHALEGVASMEPGHEDREYVIRITIEETR